MGKLVAGKTAKEAGAKEPFELLAALIGPIPANIEFSAMRRFRRRGSVGGCSTAENGSAGVPGALEGLRCLFGDLARRLPRAAQGYLQILVAGVGQGSSDDSLSHLASLFILECDAVGGGTQEGSLRDRERRKETLRGDQRLAHLCCKPHMLRNSQRFVSDLLLVFSPQGAVFFRYIAATMPKGL